MAAFAGNSLLCRLALQTTSIDAATFTAIRIAAGAMMLWLLVSLQRDAQAGRGNWLSALALFAYAAGFSFAYLSLTAATGALLLFGAVQATMIGHGLYKGERLHGWQLPGLLLALAGLIGLLLPGLAAPPLIGSLLMLGAGVAWGVYSLRGRASAAPLVDTAKNFVASVPLVLIGLALGRADAHASREGVLLALGSGVVASGIGYSLWYLALPALSAARAAIVQLCVPVIAALAGVALLGETLTARLVIAGTLIVGGLGLSIAGRSRRRV
jgi:drug/metabolite transporter (DMT)-like permease